MAPKLLRRPASASEVEDLKKRVEKLEVEKEQEKRKREKLEDVVQVVRVRVDILSNDNHGLYHRVGSLDAAVDSIEIDAATGALIKGNGKGKGKSKRKRG